MSKALLHTSPDLPLEQIRREEDSHRLKGVLPIPEDFLDKENIQVIPRSLLPLVGVGIQAEKNPSSPRIPLTLEAFSDGGVEALKIIAETRTRIARICALPQKPLTTRQLKKAIQEGEIQCLGEEGKDWFIAEDSLCLRLSQGYLRKQKALLSQPPILKQILQKGQSQIRRYLSHTPENQILFPRHTAVATLPISLGAYSAFIEGGSENGLLLHPTLLDGGRSTGLNHIPETLPFCVVTNQSDTPIEQESIIIPLSIFKSDLPPALKQYFQGSKLSTTHRFGVNLGELLDLGNPEVRRQLFEGISPTYEKNAVYARLIQANSVTPIPWEENPHFLYNQIEASLENPTGKDHRFAAIQEVLPYSNGHNRMLVMASLPELQTLHMAVQKGVNAFIFSGIQTANEYIPSPHLDGNFYMALKDFSSQGVRFIWVPTNPETPTREFFRGFWCTEEGREKLGNVKIMIDMYGWHRDEVSKEAQGSIENFFKKLKASFGSHIGVIHGNGPGFMRLADTLARKQGLLSVGVGINVEKLGQEGNFAPQAIALFHSKERLARQKVLDHLGTFKVFNIGGFGTMEEASLSICSIKLGEVLPAPLIFVDESSTPKEHLWEDLARQVEKISTQPSFTFGKNTISIEQTPLGPSWVKNIIHLVDDYEKAAEIIISFLNNPLAYWEHIGLLQKTPEGNYLPEGINHLQLVAANLQRLNKEYDHLLSYPLTLIEQTLQKIKRR